ncbi:MAG: hypothetical protein GY758_11725 [Fuerstiella sp.]|nr:hypothetical protein [Fuerstiella sp.]MCP4511309.1 hypothetical protein [Fuerstiella sp.]MDG2130924.1 hypothetical protein [Fuerstiella sp.]
MTGTSGKRVLNEHQVRVSSAPVRVGTNTAAPGPRDSGTANINEVRDQTGNLVEIHVTCDCGKTVVIACDYS